MPTLGCGIPGGAVTRTPDVTVVVVTYNSAQHLSALGQSLSEGTLTPERMLVVDNASGDATIAAAREAGFDVIEAQSNLGFGTACNIGLRTVSTEFVLFCNPDTRPSPDALQRLATVLKNNSNAAVVGAALDDRPTARQFTRISGEVVGFLPGFLRHRLRRFECARRVSKDADAVVVDYAVGAFVLCRVSALRAIGGFDEAFFLYFEEEDLCRRLSWLGWQTLLVPRAHVAHKDSASCDGFDQTSLAPFRIHSIYRYYRKYHARTYAEFARCAFAACVSVDRLVRAVARQRQVYGSNAALAPFRNLSTIRREHDRSVRA